MRGLTNCFRAGGGVSRDVWQQTQFQIDSKQAEFCTAIVHQSAFPTVVVCENGGGLSPHFHESVPKCIERARRRHSQCQGCSLMVFCKERHGRRPSDEAMNHSQDFIVFIAVTSSFRCLRRHSGVNKRVVLADVSPERKPERGYILDVPPERKPERGYIEFRMLPRNGTRAHSPKPPFCKTALLSPSELQNATTTPSCGTPD